jgi:hypothetical protein
MFLHTCISCCIVCSSLFSSSLTVYFALGQVCRTSHHGLLHIVQQGRQQLVCSHRSGFPSRSNSPPRHARRQSRTCLNSKPSNIVTSHVALFRLQGVSVVRRCIVMVVLSHVSSCFSAGQEQSTQCTKLAWLMPTFEQERASSSRVACWQDMVA